MKIRFKMQCSSVERHAWGGRTMKASCAYTGTQEDNNFSKTTPTGNLTLQIDNPTAKDIIAEGDYFFGELEVIQMPNGNRTPAPDIATRHPPRSIVNERTAARVEYAAGFHLGFNGQELPDEASAAAWLGWTEGADRRQPASNEAPKPNPAPDPAVPAIEPKAGDTPTAPPAT